MVTLGGAGEQMCLQFAVRDTGRGSKRNSSAAFSIVQPGGCVDHEAVWWDRPRVVHLEQVDRK